MKRELLLKFNKPIEKHCWLCKNKENLIQDKDKLWFCYDFSLHQDRTFPKWALFKEMQDTFITNTTKDVKVYDGFERN